ncbi:MAG: hypothetical protein HY870_10760 [Chloroflexi bacterium]|nr:hypothetical protein [Chloroflexota bacterium]
MVKQLVTPPTLQQARDTLQTECTALAEKLAAEQTMVSQQAKLIVLTEARQQKQP